jgi:CRISPR-associated protein Cmr5
MPQTLDQQRARFAWDCATRNVPKHGKEYVNLTKGAPALIMGNGLMPALAFFESRNKNHATDLLKDILTWLARRLGGIQLVDGERFPREPVADFRNVLMALQLSDSALYMRATDETLSMLKWLRQFADAVK